MNKNTLFGFIISISLILLAAYGISKAESIITKLESKVALAIIAASVTIIVSSSTLLFTKKKETEILVLKEHRAKKIPIYEELIDFYFDILKNTQLNSSAPSQNEIIEFFSSFSSKLIVWGSDEVILSFVKLRNGSKTYDKNETSPLAFLSLLEDLLIEIRKDLGHKNKGFSRGSLLGLFITDLEKHISSSEK